jgi:hypothetical protein
MKRLAYITLWVMFAFSLGACAKGTSQPSGETVQPAAEAIKPGEKIGDFLITTGEGDEVTYTWDLDCVKTGEGEIYSCKVPAGTKVNLSVGIYDDTFKGKLDEVWAGHTYEMFIENRPVSLQDFGSIDVNQPQVGQMRHWNVVVSTDKPGEITLRDAGVVHGEPFESTMTYVFSAP